MLPIYCWLAMTSEQTVKMPSNRRFGFLFTAVFTAVASWMYFDGALYAAWAFFAFGCLTGALAHFSPDTLAPFNKAWFLLGQLLGKVVSPIVLGIIFFGILTPVGFVGRLMGRDPLRLKRGAAATYWVDREMPSPDAASFKNQF